MLSLHQWLGLFIFLDYFIHNNSPTPLYTYTDFFPACDFIGISF